MAIKLQQWLWDLTIENGGIKEIKKQNLDRIRNFT